MPLQFYKMQELRTLQMMLDRARFDKVRPDRSKDSLALKFEALKRTGADGFVGVTATPAGGRVIAAKLDME